MSITWAVLANSPTIFAVMKRWCNDRQVVQMARPQPRIVGNIMITRPHRRRWKFLQEVPDALGHRVDVPGRPCHRLRHHPAVQVEDPRRQIPSLPHRGRESGADHDLRLLLHHRDQSVPHDLPVDLCESIGLM